MPRSGLGVFTAPFPPVVEGTTIESTVHNGTVDDFVTDANAARPITAGGTGATTAAAARTALGAEVAGQQVTNYDSHVWENGSFWSIAGATGAATPGDAFAGTCVIIGASSDYIELEARAVDTKATYVKHKLAGTWGAWTLDGDDKVSVAGDTMTGPLVVSSTLGVTGAATFNSGATINGTLDVSNVGIPGTLGVAGAATLSSTLSVTGVATFNSDPVIQRSGTPADGLIHFGNTGTNYIFYGSGTDKFNFAGAGISVGGNSAISGTLDVTAGITANTLYLQTGTSPDPTITFVRGGFTSFISHSGASWNFCSNAGATAGMMMAVNSSAWTAISDARMPYKKAARDITDRLPPLDHYRLYENANGSGIPEVFAKAQEVDGLFPQLVHRGSDDPDHVPTGMGDPQAWGLSYDRMGAIALAYIKQLTERIEELERRLNAKPS